MPLKAFDKLTIAFKSYFVWLAIFSTAANVLMLVAPIYMIQVYDRVLPSRGLETLFYLSLITIVALALYGLIEALRSIASQKLAARYEFTAAPGVLTGAFAPAADSETANALRQVGVVKQLLASRNFVNLFDLPFAPLFLLILAIAHPLLGIVTLVGCGILCALAWMNARSLGNLSEIGSAHGANAARFATAAIRQNDDIRAMAMTGPMLDRWRGEAMVAAQASDAAANINAFYYGITRFVRQVLQVGILGLGAYLVLEGQMSAGLIFAASLLSGRALQPIEQVIGSWRQFTQAMSGHREVGVALAAAEASAATRTIALPEPKGHLTVARLGMAVGVGPDAPLLLKDVTLEALPGELLALIGPSGAGKSTLARIMAGTIPQTSGTVRLDGFELHQWNPAQRGRAIGYVGQDTEMLEGSVAENIARFDPEASDEAIIEAAQRANAHGFIATMPDGYRTRLGPGGIRLSGGQVQRLALARALYGKPALLILDEPNAHLDSDGEKALLDALMAEKARGAAIVVVTQRTGLLAIADKVAIIKNGRVDQFGPRDTVLPRPAAPVSDIPAAARRRFVSTISDYRRVRPDEAAPAMEATDVR